MPEKGKCHGHFYEGASPGTGADSHMYVVLTTDPVIAREIAGTVKPLGDFVDLFVVFGNLERAVATSCVAELEAKYGKGKFSKQALDPA